MPAALAQAADHFFVGQHGAQRGTPIDRRFGLIGQPVPILIAADRLVARGGHVGRNRQLGDRPAAAGLGVEPGVEQLQKNPLRPAEVVDVGRGQLAVPVVAEAEHLLLPAERVDVLLGRDARRRAGLLGVLLGRQAKGVPAHRVQHALAAHPVRSGRRCRWPFALRDGRRAGRRRWDRETCRARTAFRPAAGAARRTCGALPNTAATWARRRPDCNGAWWDRMITPGICRILLARGSGGKRARRARCAKLQWVVASGAGRSAPQGQKPIAGGSAAGKLPLRVYRPRRGRTGTASEAHGYHVTFLRGLTPAGSVGLRCLDFLWALPTAIDLNPCRGSVRFYPIPNSAQMTAAAPNSASAIHHQGLPDQTRVSAVM